MKAAPFVLLGLTCLSVVLAAPSLPTGGPKANRAPSVKPAPWSVNDRKSLQNDQWGSGETTLARNGDGHFYADVVANGVTSHMLVDTGATVVALTGEDAQAMGFTWEPDDVKPIGEGANGAVYGFPVTLDNVQLGQIELNGVSAMVVPEGLGISLLGQSFLGRLDNVQMGPEKMTLGS